MSLAETLHPAEPMALPPGHVDRPRVKWWTREEYYALVEQGVFNGRRFERAFGEIVEMPSMKDPHAFARKLADYTIRPLFDPAAFTVQIQCPLAIGTAHDPEPDIAVVAGGVRTQSSHPTTALLIIDAADTSLRYDRVVKGAMYAEANVPDYWILNLVDHCLEIYRNPVRVAAKTFEYDPPIRLVRGQSMAPLARPDALVTVDSLLP
jgi:Uma2 family endonuclease